ncbi:MAG: HsdM family class I SAM-dependent methyltransferase, partial [Lentimonas sp.]
LKTAVDELDAIEFRKLGPDVKGDIFEYLLQFMATTEAANFGQFRTPKQIRNFMVRMVDPDYTDSIYDPSCGTAGFLIDAVDHILARYSEAPSEYPIYGESWLASNGYQNLAEAKEKVANLQTYRKGPGDLVPEWEVLQNSIFGHDVSPRLVRIAMMNLVLHGLRGAKVRKANSLSETAGLSEDERDRRYKVILSNPPFAGQLPRDSIRSDLPTNSKKTELLFFSLVMESLAPGGRCAVVLPEGVLFGSTSAHKELRKKLFDEFEVQAVVSLNSGVFKPYAGVKTSVLVFSKPTEGQKPKLDKVWFYDVRNDGFDPEKVSGGGRVETPSENQIPELLEQWAKWKQSSFSEVPGVPSDVILEADAPEPQSWWVSKDFAANNDYNLSAAQYKPQRASAITEECPKELIEGLAKLESSIISNLEALKKGIN